ncbi:DUF397 domain-containing protein [Actinomadura sp. 6N118]|uniref:DUF397 domain-containing protein n=1 Tax=Actinomadura sp. 6N118 TaxID=3375151 RepID=UPI00378A3270
MPAARIGQKNPGGSSVSALVANSARWRKSTRCGGSATCVEVGVLPNGQIGTRDTKDGTEGPILSFSTHDWRTFLTQAKSGEFDLSV